MIEYFKRIIDKENSKMTKVEQGYELKFGVLGHECMIRRYEEYGHLCGYIKKKSYIDDEIYESLGFLLHGGITYENDEWIGFDCNHARDFSLSTFFKSTELEEIYKDTKIHTHIDIDNLFENETYRNLDYVKENMVKAIFIKELEFDNVDNLVKSVEQWSEDKGLDQGNSFSQFAKSAEELGEVASALCRNDKDLLRDGIGDVVVTLIILAQQNGMDLHECLNTAYDEIKGRTGVTTEDGRFIKESDL